MLDPRSTVWDLVERRATATPHDTMAIDERGRTITFAGYRDHVERTAAGLRDGGVRPGSTAAWQLPATIEAVVLMGALARVGAVQVPVIPVLRHREVGFILHQASASTFVVAPTIRGFDHGALAHQLAGELGVTPIVLDEVPAGDALGLPVGDPATLGPPPTSADEPRWIYYTSGTTADPKGARHTDTTVLAAGNAMIGAGQVGPADTICAPIPITHIGGVMMLSVCLRAGCRLLVFDAFDPVTTPRLAAEHGASVIGGVGPMFPAFFAAQRAHGAEPLLPRLRYFFSGGAPVPPHLHHEVRATLGGIGVAAPWGLTEAPQVTFPPLDAGDARLSGTTGRPAPGVDVLVTDDEGRALPSGVEGELRVRGPQRFLGYVDATLDAAAIDAEGYLRTGDLGSIDEAGFVRVTGRRKDVVIRNGENISATEVEQLLLTHPAVADVAVVGLPDDRTGERACAVVELANGSASLNLEELRRHVEQAGAARQKAPEQLVLVASIPRNDLGKVQKFLLREQLLSRGPAAGAATPSPR